ncbi:MAG: response regulator [bacterium]
MDIIKLNKTVLTVDDDDNLRNVLVDKLTVTGFETLSAVNGEEGLKIILEKHPDAILLDALMPKMNGWQVLEKLREDEWGKTANVIMLTSLEQVDFIAHAMEKGVFTYIVKSNLVLDDVIKIVKNTLHI